MDVGPEIRFESVHCSLVLRQRAARVMLLEISGRDVGEFGEAPLRELGDRVIGRGPVHLFIDAREVRAASLEVSADWARWLRAHKVELRCVSMLTGSRFVQITADFVRRYADLEAVMRVYTEVEAFEAALAEALATAG